MPAGRRLARTLGAAGVGLLVGAAAGEQEPKAPRCPEPDSHRQCLLGCEPANLIFLPCMAVGAKAMAACREREIAWCVETCRRRFC